MMNEDNKPQLNGCAVAAVLMVGFVILAIIAAVLYVLFSFGSFLGGL